MSTNHSQAGHAISNPPRTRQRPTPLDLPGYGAPAITHLSGITHPISHRRFRTQQLAHGRGGQNTCAHACGGGTARALACGVGTIGA